MNEWKKKPLLDLTFFYFFAIGQDNFIVIMKNSGKKS